MIDGHFEAGSFGCVIEEGYNAHTDWVGSV